ncbi:MAG: D-alanyl-D-alanine carboxypeptidase/D-alanyl-D-alanine-endopeptidase [Acidobacteriota bacterium]|jgi:D-alanyl-D-alanine carboxypeptidase/D-alanyl-D-alanine-endopeptidase (penicillin-binding protein 4)
METTERCTAPDGRRKPAPAPALVLVLALALSSALAPGAFAAGGDGARHRLNRAINAQVARALRVAPELGVLVTEVKSGETVYSYRADVPRIPASNTKLFTTAAALDLLGPSWFFETPLLLRGRVENGVLHGDLAVVGSGDPTFSGRWTGDPYSVFRRWSLFLLAHGVRRVEGDLVLVHGRFEGPEVHPDWPEDQRARWYQAPVSALTFSDNCVLLAIRPSRSGRPRIDLVPPLGVLGVRNATMPSGSPRRHRVRIVREPESSEVAVGGDVYRGAPPVEAWVTVPDPPRYFGAALRDALAERGIELGGRLRPTEHLPAGAWQRIISHRSDLLTAIEVTNRRSQNLFAETILKTLGAETCGDGSWRGGVRAVEGFLERVGIAPGSYSMADGSGLSRNNRFTPEQIVRLLRFMLDHRWGRELMGSLAVSGMEDQSLEDRLDRPPFRGAVHAKTGTLSGVSALSGYARGRSGTLYAFSILANRTRSAWQARDAQDAILRALISNG